MRRGAQCTRHLGDLPAATDEHRAALVAGGPHHLVGDAVVGGPGGRHVDDREQQRAPEQVVAGEVLAADDGEDQRHDGYLEQRADDPREPRPLGTLGVQARAGEQQRREQIGEGQELPRAVGRVVQVHRPVDRFLEQQRGEDRERDRGEVEGQQRDHPQSAPDRGRAREERQRRGTLAADVALADLERHRRGGRRVGATDHPHRPTLLGDPVRLTAEPGRATQRRRGGTPRTPWRRS